MHFLDRRDFFKATATAAGAFAGASLLDLAAQEPAAPRGANERLNVAVVGVGGRGGDHVRGFAGRNNCVVTHVCDADSARAMLSAHVRPLVDRLMSAWNCDRRALRDHARALAVESSTELDRRFGSVQERVPLFEAGLLAARPALATIDRERL